MVKKVDKKRSHDFSFYIFKWLIIGLIGILALGLITKPLRKMWATNYFEKGESYLEQKKYESAILEYRKSLFLFWKNDQASGRIALARESSVDILKLENFYRERKLDSQLQILDKIAQIPSDETDAIKLSKELIEKGEYQYAILAAQTGTEMSRDFRDAWLYLGIANLKAMKMLELTDDSRNKYRDDAKNALEKAKNLDPQYQPTKDYLEELNKIK